ncbi:phage protein Gp36 family protein [Limibacter armeniacum]
MEHCINIVLYRLHKKAPIMPEDILYDYNNTLAYLEKVAEGKIGLMLPRALEEDMETPRTRFKLTANTKRSH